MAELVATEQQSAEWWNLVARFRQAAAQVDQVLERLRAQEDAARSDPGLSSQYDAIMQRAAELRATIADYLGKIDAAVQWLKGAGAWIADAFGFNGLGALPVLIGVAAIAAALAAVTKFLTDAWALSKRIDEQQRLEARGLTPQEAAAVVERGTAGSAGSQWLKLLAGAAAVGFVGWLIVNNRRADG
jgi:hypothetical protein